MNQIQDRQISSQISQISRIRKSRSFGLFLASFLTLMFFYRFTPPIVSFDGNLYIASGKSLFSTTKMAEFYHWAREPLYPFLIFVSIKMGSLKILFLIQALIVSVGIAITIDRWLRASGRMWGTLHGYSAAIISASLVHGYTTSVLQVSLFILLVGFFSDFVYRFSLNKTSVKAKYIYVVALSVFVSFLSLNGILSFMILQVLLFFFSKQKKYSYRLFLTSVLVVFVCTLTWTQIKESLNTGQSYFQGVETPSEGIKLFLDPNNIDESLERIQQAPLSLLGLAPDRFLGLNFQKLSFEGRIYGLPLTEYLTRCGKVDPSIPPINDYISDVVITDHCIGDRSERIFNFINFVLGKSLPFIGFLFYALLLSISQLIRMKNFQLIAPVALLLPYVLLGAANSRYGAPALVFGVIYLIDLISRLRRVNHVRDEGS
jgi:hypothetical protein